CPFGRDASRTMHDGKQRRYVIGLKAGVEGNVDMSRRHQGEEIGVTTEADELGTGPQPFEALAVKIGHRRANGGGGELYPLTGADWLRLAPVVAPRPLG